MKRRFGFPEGFSDDDDTPPPSPPSDWGDDDDDDNDTPPPSPPPAKQSAKEPTTSDTILPIPPDPPHIIPPRPVLLSKIPEEEMDKFIKEYRMSPGTNPKERIRKFHNISPLPTYSEVQDMESRIPNTFYNKTLTKKEEKELVGPEFFNVYSKFAPISQKLRISHNPNNGFSSTTLFAVSEKASKEIKSSQNVFAKSTVIAPPMMIDFKTKTQNTETATDLFATAMARERLLRVYNGHDEGVTRMVQYIAGDEHAGLGIYEHIPSPNVQDRFWLFDSAGYFVYAGLYSYIAKIAARITRDARKLVNEGADDKDPQHLGVRCMSIDLDIQRGSHCAIISGTLLTLIPDIPFAATRIESHPSKWVVDDEYYREAIKGLLRTLHELNKDEFLTKNSSTRLGEKIDYTPNHEVFYDFLRDRLLEPLITGTPYGLGYLLPRHSRKD